MNRAAVFIDIGYLGKVLKYCFGEPRIDFERFSDLLCEDRERLRTYVYDCTPFQDDPPTEEEMRRAANHERFVNSLARLNRFEIRLGRTARNLQTGEFYQKRIEVLLTVDLMRMAWSRQIETAILVTGENDYVPAIESAKDAGLLIVIWYRDCFDPQGRPMTRTSDEILGICDECVPIGEEHIAKSKF
ncbi:MAG: NYN domain-containing protein [Candidatus Thorarchaeota archaeon]|nr:NYN domain-containing protein [Candidatus Thorarchaeota archaeon]